MIPTTPPARVPRRGAALDSPAARFHLFGMCASLGLLGRSHGRKCHGRGIGGGRRRACAYRRIPWGRARRLLLTLSRRPRIRGLSIAITREQPWCSGRTAKPSPFTSQRTSLLPDFGIRQSNGPRAIPRGGYRAVGHLSGMTIWRWLVRGRPDERYASGALHLTHRGWAPRGHRIRGGSPSWPSTSMGNRYVWVTNGARPAGLGLAGRATKPAIPHQQSGSKGRERRDSNPGLRRDSSVRWWPPSAADGQKLGNKRSDGDLPSRGWSPVVGVI